MGIGPAGEGDEVQRIRFVACLQGECAGRVDIVARKVQALVAVVIAGVILNVSQAVYQRIREIRPAGIGAEGELAKLGVDISTPSC